MCAFATLINITYLLTYIDMLLCHTEAWDWIWPFPTITVLNSTAVGNARGIVTRHYSQPSDEYLDLFFRFHWETVITHVINHSSVWC